MIGKIWEVWKAVARVVVPMLVVLLIFGSLIIFPQSSAVAQFIYTYTLF